MREFLKLFNVELCVPRGGLVSRCVQGSSAPKLAGRRWFEVRVAGVHAPVMRGPRNDWEVPQARTRYTAFQPSNPPKSRDTGLNRASAPSAQYSKI